jgi:hypothetical protein
MLNKNVLCSKKLDLFRSYIALLVQSIIGSEGLQQ